MVDNRQLLEVLLTEIGFVGLHEIEEPADHLYDTVEMTRAHLAFHDLVESGEVKFEGGVHLFCGVHLFGRRGKDEMGAYGTEQLSIALDVTRVFGEVLFVIELRRVHEDGNDAHIVFRYGTAHQGRMSGMQRTHGGHQTNRFVRILAGLYGSLQLFLSGNDLHFCVLKNFALQNYCFFLTYANFIQKKEPQRALGRGLVVKPARNK